MTFGQADTKNVDMPYSDNLIFHLNIKNSILKRVPIDLVADMFNLYKGAFVEIGYLASMLNTSVYSLKSSNNSQVDTLGVIRIPVKLRNDDDDYIEAEETFWVVDAPT